MRSGLVFLCCGTLVGALQLGLSPGLSSPRSAAALRVPCPVVMRYYERAEGDESEIDVQRVTDLLGERQELREARDFDAADAVRDELSGMGVTVLDREGVWFVGDRMPGAAARMGGVFPAAYTRQEDDTAEVDVEKVQELLASRADLRAQRDWAGADEVRDQLSRMGIMVLDREAEWFVRNPRKAARGGAPPTPRDFGPLGHDYIKAADDTSEFDDEKLATINGLIKTRLECKMARDFATADATLTTLTEEYGVRVHDGMKTWRGDKIAFKPPGYNRSPDDDTPLDEENLAKIVQLVGERATARRLRDYNKADELRAELNAMKIFVDDKERKWFVTASGRRTDSAPEDA